MTSKRPVLEMAILGVLREGDLHGYELKKRLDDLLPSWASVSFGSLYPALARLERGGSVSTTAHSRPPDSPMTGALTGELAAFRSRRRERGSAGERGRRGRKVYSLTPEGEAHLEQLVSELDPTDDRTFTIQMALCDHLGASERSSLLVRRRAELARRLTEAQQALAELTPEREWRRELHSHSAETLRNDISWLDRLLVGEPDSSPSPPTLAGGLR